jgi:hypothetical protein
MFIERQFNPHADLKRNSYGVLEFSGSKPDLERISSTIIFGTARIRTSSDEFVHFIRILPRPPKGGFFYWSTS